MIASLVSDGLIALGLIGEEYYAILVVIGIASFLSASSRIPLTALAFAAEVKKHVPEVILSVVKDFITADELEECRRIADSLGVYLKVRDYIS